MVSGCVTVRTVGRLEQRELFTEPQISEVTGDLRGTFPTPIMGAELQLRSYLETLYRPDDLIEVMAVEKWSESGTGGKRFIHRNWLTPVEIAERFSGLHQVNTEGGNIFHGMIPRTHRAGTNQAVERSTVPTIWADFDQVSGVGEATDRWERVGLASLAHYGVDPELVTDATNRINASEWLHNEL